MKIVNTDKQTTVFFVDEMGFMVPKDAAVNYLKDAAREMDRLSKTFNPMGINAILGAMVILHDKGYNGVHNNNRTTLNAIEKEVKEGILSGESNPTVEAKATA